jgi:hypothetical protein
MLTVNFAAMAYTQDEHNHSVIFDFTIYAVVADAIFPKPAQIRTLEGLTDGARLVELGYSFVQKFQNATARLGVGLIHFA